MSGTVVSYNSVDTVKGIFVLMKLVVCQFIGYKEVNHNTGCQTNAKTKNVYCRVNFVFQYIFGSVMRLTAKSGNWCCPESKDIELSRSTNEIHSLVKNTRIKFGKYYIFFAPLVAVCT